MARNRTSIRNLLALGGLLLVPVAVAGCGDSVPGNAVARVGDETITKAEFEHWLEVGLRQSQAPGTEFVKPDPPDYKACVAAKKKSLPEPAKGQQPPTDDQLKSQCKQEYEGIRDQVMGFLISNIWLTEEANDLGVKLTEAEVKKSFEDQKKQAFPKEKDFEKFLKDSGMTLDDLMLRVRISLLEPKIREKVTGGSDKVSAEDIEKYFEENKAQFAQPERRDLHVVLTKTEAKADEAKAALEGGASFKDTAKEYSIDEATKSQGGKLLGVTKGQQEKALDDAVFDAKTGEIVGPIKTQFGYYVFRVAKVVEAEEANLSKVRTTIRQALVAQTQQEKLDEFVEKFRDKWTEETNCADGFVVESCKNAPKKDDSSTVPPGAVPNTPATPQPAPGQPAPAQPAPTQTVPEQ